MILWEKDLPHPPEPTTMVEHGSLRDTKHDATLDDLPPAYSEGNHAASAATSSTTTSTPASSSQSAFQGVKPTNMFSQIQRDSPIRGNFVLNPRLRIPLSIFPEQTEEGRLNLDLKTRDGTIDVGVYIVGCEADVDTKAKMARTMMRAHSRDGSVTVRVDSDVKRDPFLLDAYSRDGRVTVHIPRSFHGPMYLKTKDGKREVSEALRANSTTLGTSDRTMRYFIGELPHIDDGGWERDELWLETRDSRIKVQYIDEIESQVSCNKGNFFARVFS